MPAQQRAGVTNRCRGPAVDSVRASAVIRYTSRNVTTAVLWNPCN